MTSGSPNLIGGYTTSGSRPREERRHESESRFAVPLVRSYVIVYIDICTSMCTNVCTSTPKQLSSAQQDSYTTTVLDYRDNWCVTVTYTLRLRAGA